VTQVRTRLLTGSPDLKEIESVVIEENGRFVYDVAIVDLLIASQRAKMSSLVVPPATVTVSPEATIDEVATLLVESRRTSILVVDDGQKALGRIFADDIVDALLPDAGF